MVYVLRNISSLNKLEKRHPRQSLRKNRRSPSGRYNSNVIRLANNNLVDTRGEHILQIENSGWVISPAKLTLAISGLYKMALDVVEYPEDIAWLDLSFNDIETISEDILEFPALKVVHKF